MTRKSIQRWVNKHPRNHPNQGLSIQADIPFVCTREELARTLRITPRHVYNLTRRRLLHATRLGRSVRYTRSDVLKALEVLGGES